MGHVRGIFKEVKPVVIVVARGFGKKPAIALDQRRVSGQRRWRFLFGTHVREDETAERLHRIPRLFNLEMKFTALGFGGLLETLPLHLVEPTMIRASNAA